MAISSIHIEAGKLGFFTHNDRTRKTKNSIFNDEENFYSCSAKDAIFSFKKELKSRSEKYQKRTKQKLQKKAIVHLSAIVNLNQKHNERDLKKICDYLEETLDTKILQYSIHRDEGHITSEEKSIKNYHAHIEFMGLDSQGVSVRKKLTKKMLINLQSKTAELLEMERGRNYTQEKAPRPKRLGTYEFKKHKEEEAKSILSKHKDLKLEMAKLREKLQKNKAIREDYRELEKLNNELKIRIKNKKLTIEELQVEIQNYQIKNAKLSNEKKEVESLVNSTLKPKLHEKYNFNNKIKGFLNAFKI